MSNRRPSLSFGRTYVTQLAPLIPEGKHLPHIYLVRAVDLVTSLQPVSILRNREYWMPSLSAPPYDYKNGDNRLTFNYRNPPRAPIKDGYKETRCMCCGREALRYKQARGICSAYCALALELFYNDLRAVNYLPLAIQDIDFNALLRLAPPNMLNFWMRKRRYAHYYDAYPHMLHGNFADFWGLGYASSLLINPRSLRRGLKKLMRDTSPPILDGTTSEPVGLVEPVARVPAPSRPSDLITAASMANPVQRRMAEIVLGHLETANDFLSSTKKPTRHGSAVATPSVEWNKQQVTLFLGLLNRTVPAISASLNLEAPPVSKTPDAMSREELEAAARAAKDIGKVYATTESAND